MSDRVDYCKRPTIGNHQTPPLQVRNVLTHSECPQARTWDGDEGLDMLQWVSEGPVCIQWDAAAPTMCPVACASLLSCFVRFPEVIRLTPLHRCIALLGTVNKLFLSNGLESRSHRNEQSSIYDGGESSSGTLSLCFFGHTVYLSAVSYLCHDPESLRILALYGCMCFCKHSGAVSLLSPILRPLSLEAVRAGSPAFPFACHHSGACSTLVHRSFWLSWVPLFSYSQVGACASLSGNPMLMDRQRVLPSS